MANDNAKPQDDDDDLSVQEPNADDILEEDRNKKDPNLSVLRHQSKLPGDYDSPAASQNDPITRDLPADHPAKDTDMDKTEVYEEDETDASGYWDQHESNDRTN
ncbi:MAG: hypothetical protein ACREGC_03935, partial [Minisyncoccia bacterium]